MAFPAPERPLPEAPSKAGPVPPRAGFGDAAAALRAVAALLDRAGDESRAQDVLVAEARLFFGASSAVLLSLPEQQRPAQLMAMAPRCEAPFDLLELEELPTVAELVGSGAPELWTGGEPASELARALGAPTGGEGALLLNVPPAGAQKELLVLLDIPAPSSPDVGVARAFAAAAGACLSQLRQAQEASVETARQAALARAAMTLNESLEMNRVLVRICEEATGLIDASAAVIHVGDAEQGLRAQAVYGLPAEAVGPQLRPGQGLAGKVVQRDEPMLTNDYQGLPDRPPYRFLREVRSALCVPMRWGGRLRGALTVIYKRPFLVTSEHLSLLEAFATLAAAACSNATAHSGLARAARTDALTGCLNRAAFQETLSRELERSERTGNSLSLALLDLDDFKDVNERHGHPAGDRVVQLVGEALRKAVRPYDHVARYGGDEFAIVALDATEGEAARVAKRAVLQVRRALAGYEPGALTGATAGVAEWRPGERQERLIERADDALLYGKHKGERGGVQAASLAPAPTTQAGLSEPR